MFCKQEDVSSVQPESVLQGNSIVDVYGLYLNKNLSKI